MENLYVFAIGGSGERVVKSLVMMLAAGMHTGARKIIPVFIDNDEESKAYTKCCDLIKYYNADPREGLKVGANTLYKKFEQDPTKWGSFFHTEIAEPIILNQTGEAIGNLSNVIGYKEGETKFHKAIKEEMNLIFSDNDLEMPLNVGFVGNPNIGSIVLNSLSLQDDRFTEIKKCITSNDGVIAVGSLFGGTGAAGLPLIINTMKNLGDGRQPIIGGVAVLPYFSTKGTKDDGVVLDIKKWDVSSEAFNTKTRAALMYYDEHMKLGYDYLYYVGDSEYADIYTHCRGGAKQDNPYHIIEVMSALSIIDFSKNNKSNSIVYKRPIFGFNQQDGTIQSNISGATNSDFAKSIVKFKIMKKMFEGERANDFMLKWAIETKQPYVENIVFNETCRQSVIGKSESYSPAWGVCKLMQEFDTWMNDLAKAKRPFNLFNDNIKDIDGDNITSKFYSNSKFGIANEVSTGGFLWFNQHLAPAKANIANEMQNAFKRLYANCNANNVAHSSTLPMLFRIISEALDEVLIKNCITL